MIRAFVLVKSREAEEMLSFVKGIKEVEDVSLVYGGYDMVIVIKTDELKRVGEIVLELRNRFHVDETLTLITV